MRNRIRILSGLVLLSFVIPHLFNHALGLISLDAMIAGERFTIEPWRTPLGTLLLGAAVLVHAGLAAWSLFYRKNLRFTTWELVQLCTGFLIPVLLAGHVFGTRGVSEFYDARISYAQQITLFWSLRPDLGVIQALAVLTVWTHGALGIHTWLRLKSWYRALQPYLYAFAVLLPALALAGYVSSGFEVLRLAEVEGWLSSVQSDANMPEGGSAWVTAIRDEFIIYWIIFVALILLARAGRAYLKSRRPKIRLYYRAYDNNRVVEVPPGWSVLESLRSVGIRHASVCGGRGRCTTCRIQLERGEEHLPSPAGDEAKALARISAPSGIRLACQVRPA